MPGEVMADEEEEQEEALFVPEPKKVTAYCIYSIAVSTLLQPRRPWYLL
jgi:hypothetical protein